MNKAVFLDRDGVINKLVYNKMTNEFEPPHNVGDLELIEDVIESLLNLQSHKYDLFINSNQPDYAKGKTSLSNLKEVHDKLHSIFIENKIFFKDYYYCYHHPEGIVNEYSYDCECRKPKPYFVLKAIKEFDLDPELSWFIGDRDSDISCGLSAGLKTILIKNRNSESYTVRNEAIFTVSSLKEAVEIIQSSDQSYKRTKLKINASNDKVL